MKKALMLSQENTEVLLKIDHLVDLIKDDISDYVNDILGSEYVFSAIFGGLAYEKDITKDIDLLIFTNKTIDSENIELLKKQYFKLHEKYNLSPDNDFPGEYINTIDILKSIRGKGFTLDNKRDVSIEKISELDWDDFNTYRHNLSSFFLSSFVSGDKDTYEKLKLHCITALLKTVILSNKLIKIDIDSLVLLMIGDGKKYLGFDNNKYNLQYLKKYILIVINRWIEKGILDLGINGEYFIVNDLIFNRFKYSIVKYNNNNNNNE